MRCSIEYTDCSRGLLQNGVKYQPNRFEMLHIQRQARMPIVHAGAHGVAIGRYQVRRLMREAQCRPVWKRKLSIRPIANITCRLLRMFLIGSLMWRVLTLPG